MACVLLPACSTIVFLLFGAPLSLVFVGALAQGPMLPFVALAALHFRFRQTEPGLQPGRPWTLALCASAVCMAAAGAYQVLQLVRQAFR